MQQPSTDLNINNKKKIETDFHISLQENDLPIVFSPCRINDCMVFICLMGNAEIEVDLRQFHYTTNDIIVVFPGQILACNVKSEDFKIAYFMFSNQLIDEVLYRLPAEFIGFLKESVKYQLPEKEREEIMTESFFLLNKRFTDSSNICCREIILNLLHNFYLDIYSKVVLNNKMNSPQHQRKRKKELQDEFFRLIKEHTQTREVSFFAEILCITPKYLSIVTKETTGSSAKDLIDKFAVTELKLRLKSSSTPLKGIAEQLNYPCEAFLCKYFKKHTGMTPSHYRNSSR
jgi:AraC family transcriptional regulator, transcriptional activator of pobA